MLLIPSDEPTEKMFVGCTNNTDNTNNCLIIDSESDQEISKINHNDILNSPLHLIYNAIPQQPVSIAGDIFYPSDFLRLLPGNWLNDKIINFYFDLLAIHNPSVYYFSTFLFPMLLNNTQEHMDAAFSSVDFHPYHTFFIPINFNSHWSLVKIHDNKIIPLDSIREIPLSFLQTIKSFYKRVILGIASTAGGIASTAGGIASTAGGIASTAGRIASTAGGIASTAGRITSTAGGITSTAGGITSTAGRITFYCHLIENIPKQTNGDDCGIFCCAYAKYYTGKTYEGFTSKDVPRIRMEILHEILSNRIIYSG